MHLLRTSWIPKVNVVGSMIAYGALNCFHIGQCYKMVNHSVCNDKIIYIDWSSFFEMLCLPRLSGIIL